MISYELPLMTIQHGKIWKNMVKISQKSHKHGISTMALQWFLLA